jgi:hypothetical protein
LSPEEKLRKYVFWNVKFYGSVEFYRTALRYIPEYRTPHNFICALYTVGVVLVSYETDLNSRKVKKKSEAIPVTGRGGL